MERVGRLNVKPTHRSRTLTDYLIPLALLQEFGYIALVEVKGERWRLSIYRRARWIS
jgi:hypothetical protein